MFVGEALVGNDGVDQLRKFNQALADHSDVKNPHLIDGIVLTKFDTIDDKVFSVVGVHCAFSNLVEFKTVWWRLILHVLQTAILREKSASYTIFEINQVGNL